MVFNWHFYGDGLSRSGDQEKFGFRVVRSEATRLYPLQYSVDVLLQIVAVAGRIDWLIE